MILVVEENPAIRELVVDLLTASGYVVREAEDGTGLLERVKRERPALILLDLQLPGADGFTLARQLKAGSETKGIPVLAVSAYARPEDQARVRAAGCEGYLGRLVDIRDLTETVAHLLRSDPPSSPGGAAGA
jgi:CheY-like chemotaxis protein